MSWTLITESDVKAALNNAELEKYRSIIEDGQADPLQPIIDMVTEEVRGYVRTRYIVGDAGIPVALKRSALDIIVYELAKRVVTGSDGQRKNAADDAVTLLQRVADGKHGIPLPTVPTDEQTAAPSPKWTRRSLCEMCTPIVTNQGHYLHM